MRDRSHVIGIRLLRSIVLSLLAAFAAATMGPAGLAAEKPLPSTRLFQIIMIEGNTTGTMPADGIPKVALDTLAGMKDFLPYKGYRLLDTALIRTAMHARTTLKGPNGRPFDVRISVASGHSEGPDLFFREFEVSESRSLIAPPRPPAGRPEEPEAPTPAPQRNLISTSFGMDVGETLVVGSSRLDGDQTALILLVTALP